MGALEQMHQWRLRYANDRFVQLQTMSSNREAYRLCTGEDAGATLDRYREWVEENLIGPA